MFRRKQKRVPVFAHYAQEQLDDDVLQLQTSLDLYEKIAKFAQSVPGIASVEKVKSETRQKIIDQIRQLQSTGFSLVDLITKFGETLLRSDLILAKQNVKNFQDRQGGEALVTDLFSEDDLLRNRSDRLANRFEPLVTSEKQQTFADVQGVPTAAAQRMDPAKIRASTTYEVVKQILAGRQKEGVRVAEERKQFAAREVERVEEEEKKIEEAAEGVDENILAAARREVLEGQEHLTEEQKQTRLASNLKSKIDELETLQRKQQAAKKMAEVLKAGKKAKNFEEEKQMLAEIQRDIPEEVLEIMQGDAFRLAELHEPFTKDQKHDALVKYLPTLVRNYQRSKELAELIDEPLEVDVQRPKSRSPQRRSKQVLEMAEEMKEEIPKSRREEIESVATTSQDQELNEIALKMKKFDNLQKKENIFSKGEGADVLKNAPKRAKDVVAVAARYVREGSGDQKARITEARTFIAKITDPSLVEKRLSELELELKKNPASGKQARLDIKTGEAPGFKAD